MSNGHYIFRFAILDRQMDAQLPTEIRVGPNFYEPRWTRSYTKGQILKAPFACLRDLRG
jgi:hypothetical protein